MSTPEFKVYDKAGTYQACAKEPHAAAILAEHYEGTVRWLHKHTVWTAGEPTDSHDETTDRIGLRVEAATHPRVKARSANQATN